MERLQIIVARHVNFSALDFGFFVYNYSQNSVFLFLFTESAPLIEGTE
jgi:hypothetical protein